MITSQALIEPLAESMPPLCFQGGHWVSMSSLGSLGQNLLSCLRSRARLQCFSIVLSERMRRAILGNPRPISCPYLLPNPTILDKSLIRKDAPELLSSMLRVLFDGLCEPQNPGGVACYGFVVYQQTFSGEQRVVEDYGVAAEPNPDSTHNVAEYTGLIRGLEWIQNNMSDRSLEIQGDSQLVIRQLTGEYKVRAPRVIPLYERACSLLGGFEWTAKWIPREQNTVADELSEKAYTEYCMRKYGRIPPTMRQTGAIE